MCARRILFVDNDPEFLSTRAEILERAGYQVTKVDNLNQAEVALAEYWFHMVILDVRLIDDYDERDLSGLKLAKQDAHKCIPKIILTKFPEYVQDMLDGLSPILEFVAKGEDPQILLRSMDRAFANRLHLNWELLIQFNLHSSVNFLQMVSLVEIGLTNELVLDRANELEDLFRKIFFENNKIRVDRLLWQRNGRIALVVIAFKENGKPESFLVVCGKKSLIQADLIRYKEYSPKAHAGNGTILVESSETVHFAACIYALTSNSLEKFQTLQEAYRYETEKSLNIVLTGLFQNTLYGWHQGVSISSNEHSLEPLYFDRLKLSENILASSFFEGRLKYMEHHAPSLGVQFTRAGGKILVRFRFNDKPFTFPDPFDVLRRLGSPDDVIQLVNVSGNLEGDNVLVGEDGRSWVTDFSEAGLAPMFWNFISLESAIRFDWVETTEIFHRYEMEYCLIHSDYDRLALQDLDPSVRKPTRAIQTIRKLATRTVGRDTASYHRGILFHALRRCVDFDVYAPITSSDLARFIHVFTSVAMLASLLLDEKKTKGKRLDNGYPELRIDSSINAVLLGEKQYRLAPRPFKLLKYLYDNADRVCTNDELRLNVIGENYNPTYIHTLVGRVRLIIEADPDKAVYLITEPNIGYRLIIKP
jgi:DNA-binding response OmpR family regulator